MRSDPRSPTKYYREYDDEPRLHKLNVYLSDEHWEKLLTLSNLKGEAVGVKLTTSATLDALLNTTLDDERVETVVKEALSTPMKGRHTK